MELVLLAPLYVPDKESPFTEFVGRHVVSQCARRTLTGY